MDDGYEERINQHLSKRTCILKYPVVVRTKKRRRKNMKRKEKIRNIEFRNSQQI